MDVNEHERLSNITLSDTKSSKRTALLLLFSTFLFVLFLNNFTYSETCLNRTLNKTYPVKTCLNRTLNKTYSVKIYLNRTLNKTDIL
jgi:hypothetical protein